MYVGLVYIAPTTNRLFAALWEDPSEQIRREALKRMEELCVNGSVPEEAALLLTAKELNMTERQLLDAMNLFTPGEVVKVLTGKMSPMRAMLSGIERAMKRGQGGE
jgi:hypothetical protein